LSVAASAGAQAFPQPFAPYDGRIPFRCELQYVGTGTAFPHPEADPFCVEFDKTNQNVTDFGIAEFALQEPARVAAASSKCFYFQRDHWTGSIVQGSQPELWHWDGDYFFDRAKGIGGVSVRNFRIGGVKQDARPFVPPAYQPYFHPEGGGGVMMVLETGPDPACKARVDTPEEAAQVYADFPALEPCVEPGGPLRGRRIGAARLGAPRDRVLRKLGPPSRHSRRVDRWCLVGDAELRAAYGRRDRVEAVLTTARGHALRGVAPGDRVRRARHKLDVVRTIKRRGTRVLVLDRDRRRRAFVGLRRGRVAWLAIARPGVGTRITRWVP
jgi:hypothetical protein